MILFRFFLFRFLLELINFKISLGTDTSSNNGYVTDQLTFTKSALETDDDSPQDDTDSNLLELDRKFVEDLFMLQNFETKGGKWQDLRLDPHAAKWTNLCFRLWASENEVEQQNKIVKCRSWPIFDNGANSFSVYITEPKMVPIPLDALMCKCPHAVRVPSSDEKHIFYITPYKKKDYFYKMRFVKMRQLSMIKLIVDPSSKNANILT